MRRPVSRYNSKVVFQRNTVVTDTIRNRTHTWMDYFSCYAYVNTVAMASQAAQEAEKHIRQRKHDGLDADLLLDNAATMEAKTQEINDTLNELKTSMKLLDADLMGIAVNEKV